MQQRLFSFYQRLILQRPLVTLLATLLILAGFASHIPNFKLDASADSLVLEGDKDLEFFREINKRYGADDYLVVTYTPEQDLLSDAVLAQLDALQSDLAQLPKITSVVSILDVPLLQSPPVTLEDVANDKGIMNLRMPELDRELARKELTTSPVYKSLLTSLDTKTTALQVNIQRDEQYFKLLNARDDLRALSHRPGFTQAQQLQLQQAEQAFRDYAVSFNKQQAEMVNSVRQVLDRYRGNAQLFLGGVPMIAVDMIDFVKSDLVVFGSGIMLFIIFVMAVIFKRPSWVIVPLATCLATVVFMMGLITWLDWRMTVISSNFVALLLIITLSITIHLIVRYREVLHAYPDDSQAQLVAKTTQFMAKPCLYTTLTTNVAFASLVVSGIRPVIDFGWMMTVGVSTALVLSFVLLPSIMLLMKKPALSAAKSDEDTHDAAMTLWFAKLTEHHKNKVLIAALLLAGLSAWGVSLLKVENRFIDYFKESTEIYQGMELIDEQLGGTIPLEIIIDAEASGPVFASTEQPASGADDAAAVDDFADDFEDDFFADDVSFADDDTANAGPSSIWFTRTGLARIEQVHDYIDSLPETGKVMSLATTGKMLEQLSPGYDNIQLALIQKKLPEDIHSLLLAPYLDEEIDQARISIRVKETSRSLQRDELMKQIKSHLVNELGFAEDNVRLSGMLVLYNNMLQSLFRSQILTLGAVFLGIMLMFVVLFRSFKMALLAITPNLLAATLVLGGMGLIGIPLDIMTVTIAAITIGIGVDDTIHYVHRFKDEFEKDRNYIATMYRCHASTGQAMYYTSVTIVLGFSILALSNFKPSIYFGLLTASAMFAALMGALLLLPQLIIAFKPLGKEGQ
ncbi:MMPL family transporter [Dasania sp. GY-MA-18]|uniref:MMPL family transporter n=1 Tax=Dasania phycosphaerae TaxID=2950436 RepID=A0A9J6RGT3_9GAMM|nr:MULTISPECIES: MMPL family transporter [Dasania]MCR8921223.1 MMPL family transporter [Dasania sp. GY-MA-18]MCZ0863651.1 MMPL family transporter [Dasania phycosphaerae]MCZ0867379.1 MMPL family transporter [Dasania phycosphaerae]